jgi:YidC/Oxa1 family membrane protein insertase
MEERRLLLAFALALLVLMAYSLLFAPPATPPQPPVQAPQATTAPKPTTAPQATPTGTPRPTPAQAEAKTPAAATAGAPPLADSLERRVEVTALDYGVAFTNRGAGLVSWTLARHRDAEGRPEEMVPAYRSGPRPLEVVTGDGEIDGRIEQALFVPSSARLTVAREPQTLRFRFSDGEIEAEKTFVFRSEGLVAVTAAVRRDGKPVPSRLFWGPGVGNPTAAERDVRGYQEPRGVALGAGGLEHLVAAKLPPDGREFTGLRWVGIESQYFAALFVLPADAAGARVKAETVQAGAEEKPRVEPIVLVDASASEPALLFVGAKDYRALERLGHGLQRVVPVGDWIGPIVVALMGLLRWVQGLVGNWGWSIVLVTILINLVMAPFRHYSIVNGLKMAKLSPEMRVIQERYRKVPLMDPRRQKMQEEIQALYARHGMSMGSQMMVGCLPLLLTMPFLFAFYRVLAVSVELRGAPFLWIPDLAQKDPLFLTPILMGVSMYAMQKMTPSTMDPAQQRIMMLMPLMLAGMFLWAPAGLNLYWLTANLWSIAQQFVEMRVLKPAEGGRAARERRPK